MDEVRLADRLALRALVDRYAQGADRRRPDQVAAQFTPDGVLTICTDPDGEQSSGAERRGRDEIAEAMRGLERVPRDHAPRRPAAGSTSTPTIPTSPHGETYCEAHHLRERDGVTVDRVMSIRYQDRYARVDGTWLIAHRLLLTDWTEDREVQLA